MRNLTESAIVSEEDVRAMIHLLGAAAALDGGHQQVKRFIMNGLCELIGSDSWVWTLACETAPGRPQAYVNYLHGGFDEARFAKLLSAVEHVEMAGAVREMYLEMEKTLGHTTMVGEEIDPTGITKRGEAYQLWKEINIGPIILSGRPLDANSVSMIGIYRSHDAPIFTTREKEMVHIILNEVSWLHLMGWPEDRGATIPRLRSRQRVTLNLLMEGLPRKVIADKMDISENTVAGYVREIFAHFGVNSQVELMQKFHGAGGGVTPP
ncbi:LuxR C-terminal-related transcriptional regulator [Verrucomicrobiaceae bacterium 227]